MYNMAFGLQLSTKHNKHNDSINKTQMNFKQTNMKYKNEYETRHRRKRKDGEIKSKMRNCGEKNNIFPFIFLVREYSSFSFSLPLSLFQSISSMLTSVDILKMSKSFRLFDLFHLSSSSFTTDWNEHNNKRFLKKWNRNAERNF